MPNYPTLNTPLRNIPWQWLRYIEPKIVRATIDGQDCWFWQGSFKLQNGEERFPQVRVRPEDDPRRPPKYVSARRYIAKLFWDIEGMYVFMSCDQHRCVNPDHMVVSTPNDPNFRRG
jgi:hypothetical protein